MTSATIRRWLLPALASAALVASTACNGLTGADDLEVSNGEGGAARGTDPLTPVGATIAKISISQGVERVLVKNGAEVSSKVPIVPKRDAMIRVFIGADAGAVGTTVHAKLWFGGKLAKEQTLVVPAHASEADLASTFDFPIAGGEIGYGSDLRVELSGDAVVSPLANYPVKGGNAQLPVSLSPESLNIVIVPIRYDFEGANRLPDTSPKAIASYRAGFEHIYPIGEVSLTVRSAWSWNRAVNPTDQKAWQDLLDAFATVRADDGAPFDAYYFGAFAPAPSYDEYCGGECIEGLGYVVSDAEDAASRAAVGLDFPELIQQVAPHEIGHGHGRQHAPCGATMDIDPNYPYPNGVIGSWGLDLETKTVEGPKANFDIMGYCAPYWISDYNYAAIFERMQTVRFGADRFKERSSVANFERARVGGDGKLVSLSPIALQSAGSVEHRVEMETEHGVEVTLAHYAPYDHADGGVLTWRAPTTRAKHTLITMGERVLELTP